ncbi:MAG: hypothetical protein K2F95_03255 [Alistipes sp.]|nr:hypothetical protein [Alistipes sp.]MDE7130105.1 hypothetical protein [Alistipes sp.]
MTDFQTYIATAEGDRETLAKRLDNLLQRYPWFSLARIARRGIGAPADEKSSILSGSRLTSMPPYRAIDIAALTRLTEDDIIDRFLKKDDYRIVSQDGEATEEVRTESSHDDETEMISEELAQIYLAQGMYGEAIDIYRRLSLLNSEKSVYFVELIAQIEAKTK